LCHISWHIASSLITLTACASAAAWSRVDSDAAADCSYKAVIVDCLDGAIHVAQARNSNYASTNQFSRQEDKDGNQTAAKQENPSAKPIFPKALA
jgi:hypothetical protein